MQLSDTTKERIIQDLRNRIAEEGMIKFAIMPQYLREKHYIDWHDYAANGMGFNTWFSATFPIHRLDQHNFVIRNYSGRTEQCRMILREHIKAAGNIRMNEIPEILERKGINYRELSAGEGLKNWLNTWISPDFRITDDDIYLELIIHRRGEVAKKGEVDESFHEIHQMHTFAFMSWWSSNQKLLNSYVEEGYTEKVWCEKIAHAMAARILGIGGSILDASEDETPRIAFRIDQKNKGNQELYCVLHKNPLNTDGTKQPWSLESFCSPDDDSANSLGSWLSERFETINSLVHVTKDDVGKATEIIEKLEACRNTLEWQQIIFSDSIAVGRPLQDDLVADIYTYCSLWKELQEVIASYTWFSNQEELTLETLKSQMSSKNSEISIIDKLLEHFGRIADKAQTHFALLRLACSEHPTTAKDKISVEMYLNSGNPADLDRFLDLIYVYEQLHIIMSHESDLDEKIDHSVDILERHFSEFYRNFINRHLMGSLEEDSRFDDDLFIVRDLVQQMKSRWALKSTKNKTCPDVDQLYTCLAEYRNGSDTEKLLVNVAFFPANELETAVVEGDWEKAKDILKNGTGCPNLTPKEREETFQRICDKSESLPEGLSLYEAGVRLTEIYGNRNRTAEKYFIVGLTSEAQKILPILLDIQRLENDKKNFSRMLTLFNEVQLSEENQIYYLQILAEDDYDRLLQYLKQHIYLTYIPEYIEAISASCPDDKCDIWTARLAECAHRFQINEFEKAVIENDRENMRKLAVPSYLVGYGYSEEEAERIGSTLSMEYPMGESMCDIGIRLMLVQENTHRLAESYFWKGLEYAQDEICAEKLLMILAQEKRWEECIALYESYEYLNNSINNQEIYLYAMLLHAPEKAKNHIFMNLQNCLRFINESEFHYSTEIRGTIQLLGSSERKPEAIFYHGVLRLLTSLENPVYKAIILQGGELREFMVRQELLAGWGIHFDLAERCGVVYKTDHYSHGCDGLSIAERLYTFLGVHDGIAEIFAAFALSQTDKAAGLMLHICRDTKDMETAYQLLSQYPILRQNNLEEYKELLYRNQEYQLYIEQFVEDEQIDCITQIKIAVAQIKAGQPVSEIMPIVKVDFSQVEPEWIVELLDAARYQTITAVADFLCENFDELMAAYSTDSLKKIITLNGKISTEEMLVIQNYTLEHGVEILAFYYYNISQIGDLDAQMRTFLSEYVEQFDDLSIQERINAIIHFKTIFHSFTNDFLEELLVLTIPEILFYYDEDDEAIAVEKIGILTEGMEFSAQAFDSLINMLYEQNQQYSYAICSLLYDICGSDLLKEQIVMFFYSIGMQDKNFGNRQFSSLLCKIFINAFEKNVFPDEILDQAYEYCLNFLAKETNDTVLYCLYQFEVKLDRRDRASFILTILYNICNDYNIRNSLNRNIDEYWKGEIPSIYQLFCDSIKEKLETAEEYLEYCIKLCSSISVSSIDMEDFTGENLSNFSEQEWSVYILNLFRYPNEASRWEGLLQMPLEDTPQIYAKLLYFACRHNPQKEGMQKKCCDYCDHNGMEDILLRHLVESAKQIPALFALQHFRKDLVYRIENDNTYFTRWREEPLLSELITVLCDRLAQERVNQDVAASHAALRDMITITIATDNEDCYHILLNKFETLLLTVHGNLGVVMICRLLLTEHYREAYNLIKKLDASMAVIKYRNLITEIAVLAEEQLVEWMKDEANGCLLNLILPDGNQPDILDLRSITMEFLLSHKQEIGSKVLCKILDIFPEDYGANDSLFILCKADFEGRLFILHRCLCGLATNEPNGESMLFYRRSVSDYAYMLACVNAIILNSDCSEEASRVCSYDFTVKAGTYCRQAGVNLSTEKLAAIDNFQTQLSANFANRSQQETTLIINTLLCRVTGNWEKHIFDCYKDSLNLTEGFRQIDIIGEGFVRGALSVAYKLESEERRRYIGWLDRMLKVAPTGERCFKQIKDLYENDYYTQISKELLDANLLEYPFEEYSIFIQIYERTLQQIISKAPEQGYACTKLIAQLVNHPTSASFYITEADKCFNKGKDHAAHGMYTAILELLNERTLIITGEPIRFHLTRERCEALSRVTGAFIGEEAYIRKLSNRDFHIWSCINTIMVMITTQRADELKRLENLFSSAHKAVCEALLKIINPTVADEEKIKIVFGFKDEITLAILCYICKHGKAPHYTFLKNPRYAIELNNRYLDISRRYPQSFVGARFRHTIYLADANNINQKVFKQLDVIEMMPKAQPVIVTKPLIEENSIPDFAKEVTAQNPEQNDMGVLRQQYEACSILDYQQRYELSREMYSISLAMDTLSENEKLDYLLKFGTDYYSYCVSSKDDPAHLEKAFSIIKELMMRKYPNTSSGYKSLVKLVRASALHELLYRGYKTLRGMVEDYTAYRSSFVRMRDMLSDPLHLDCVNLIFDILDGLSEVYSTVSASHSDMLREELKKSVRQMDLRQNSMGWVDVQSRIRALIHDEINLMDKRPELKVIILNTGSGAESGMLFGIVQNNGRAAATRIIVQASYADGLLSNQYRLEQLGTGDYAAFEIYYSLESGTELLEYEIMTSYTYNNEEYSMASQKQSIPISGEETPSFKLNAYSTEQPVSQFQITASGDIYSPSFFGRKSEKQEIHNLFDFKQFAEYKNVIIRGIRRAGKTSLLNYLMEYVKYHCPDTIVVFCNCQAIHSNIIFIVFVDTVIKKITAQYPDLTSTGAWKEFAQKWEDKKDTFEPYELEYFYIGLKKVTGCGLILVVDEIDSAFQKIEQTMGLESSAFAALRSLFCSNEVQEAVHMVFCGSNELIRYGMDGKIMNQLFQQFGDSVIEVGRLPREDINDMLVTPYAHPSNSVLYTPEALQSIWDCTGGLIWFTKLLGNCIIRYIFNQKRAVVYPSDVYICLKDILNDNYFKEIRNNSREKELLIMDALQSLTTKPTEYVTLERLHQRVARWISNDELEELMNTLIMLQLVQRSPTNRNTYRFSVALYWYYFRQSSSRFEKIPEVRTMFEEYLDEPVTVEPMDDNY